MHHARIADESQHMRQNSIVILTPIKNEEWILEPFLQACSEFADHIILLVQDTHDNSREIAAKFPKAHVVENPSSTYSEKSRIDQLLLAARKLNLEQMVLIALDADEIPINTEQALQQWEAIRSLSQEQNITFKKPDLLQGGARIVDIDHDRTLGFVDDGREYVAREVHAQRLPRSESAPVYHANAIPILHVNLVREKILRAKRRMYCAIENVKATKPLYQRLHSYSHTINFSEAGKQVELPGHWKDYLNSIGLDTVSIPQTPPFWQDYEVLKLFREHGTQRFIMDDIWDIDWEQTRNACLTKGWNQVPDQPIAPQTAARRFLRFTLRKLTYFAFSTVRSLKRR